VETIRYGFVEAFLLLQGASRIQRELDEHAVLGTRDSKIAFVGDVVLGRMLGDDLKAIVRGRLQGVEHRFVDDVGDRALVVRGLAADDIDAG